MQWVSSCHKTLQPLYRWCQSHFKAVLSFHLVIASAAEQFYVSELSYMCTACVAYYILHYMRWCSPSCCFLPLLFSPFLCFLIQWFMCLCWEPLRYPKHGRIVKQSWYLTLQISRVLSRMICCFNVLLRVPPTDSL